MSFESNKSKSFDQSTPYDPNDEDLGPSVSMAVMANNDDDFKKSTFGMKRTTSIGKFGIKKNQFTSLSSSNISNQHYQPLTPPSQNNDVITHNFNDIKENSPRMHTPSQASMSPEPINYMTNNYSHSKSSSKINFNNQNDPCHILPRDDAYLSQEPSNHVDYLSHNWDESEISKSWKYIILQKKRKNNENNNDSLGLLHHEDSYSRSGSIASHSGTPQETRFDSNGNEFLNENVDNNKLIQQKDMEVDMDTINASRLENASWRTWAKARNNLKTVSPEILNWSKDNDITWLYGPIVPTDTSSPIHAEPEIKKNEDNHLKPILKKRTVTEVIERNAKWKLDQIRKNYMKNHGGKLPSHKLDDHSNYRTHSPAVYGSNEINKEKDKTNSLYPHEDFQALAAKVNAQYSQGNSSSKKGVQSQDDPKRVLEDKKMMMATLLSTDKSSLKLSEPNRKHFDSSMSSSPLQNVISTTPTDKHIRFNDRVEQCISLLPSSYNTTNQKHTRGSSDEEDFKRMRKRSKIVLPSGITLGTGNGGSSDESTSSDSDWDMDSDGEDNNLQPEFIEDSRKKDPKKSKTDYSKAYTRYYRGPALPVSDSSDGSNSDDEDDIFSLKTTINPSNEKASSMYAGTPPYPLKNSHGLNKPELLKMNSDSVVTIKQRNNKKTYPPSIKRIPATKLNYCEEPRTMPMVNDINIGSLGDSHGYNNYDYNSVFKHDNTILDNNSDINIVDVPLEYAPSQAKRDSTFNVDEAISKKASSNLGLSGGLSRTSSATSGLAKGFADSLRLNSTGQGLNTLSKKPSKGGFMFSLDSDSDEEDNEEDDLPRKNTSKVDLSFLTKPSSTSNMGDKPGSTFHLNGNIGEKSNSFLSGSMLSLSDVSGSQSDLRENTLSRVKTRSDSNRSLSSMNLMNANSKSVQVGKFKHNLSQPPKRSFSLFAEDSDSDD
ncbi:uncharacterized protein HGUI_03480 [Hanseniaspora guilliermondii]|uniref:Nitrogen regulatory protein areA GATA-like domain-containing protein n=1 Tax=Hanseniaspora guilliermondii TaxID=56406 RepID=A0A1L0B432_9ASCO|nr:uncharacterized protein HGUI_03480 [Hanseniaspora guilliermondii]